MMKCTHDGVTRRVPRWKRLHRALMRAESRALAAGFDRTPEIMALSDALSRLHARRYYVWTCAACRRDAQWAREEAARTPEERAERRERAVQAVRRRLLEIERTRLVAMLNLYARHGEEIA
jgi:hypothetical protein